MVADIPLIWVISDVFGDTRRYRALHLVEQLRTLKVQCRFVHLANLNINEFFHSSCSMLVLQRVTYGRVIRQLLEIAAHRDAVVFSDFDDLIFDVGMFSHINSPDFVDPIRSRLYQQTMHCIHESLQRSEGSLASTNFLAERIRLAGKPAWVHRNAFSMEMCIHSEKARVEKSTHPSPALVIGYASGTPTHNRDFEMVKPALIETLRKYPQVQLQLVGSIDPGEEWGELSDRIRRINLVPWRDLPRVLAGFDINLAPLVMDSPFAQSKSEIKWMEAAMVETPTIASPTDAFRRAIQHGKNGWLAENPHDWREGLQTLIEDRSLRKALAGQAYQDVQRDYHPAARAEQLARTLDEIFHSVRGRPFFSGGYSFQKPEKQLIEDRTQKKDWLPTQYEREPSYFKLGLYMLRNRGLMVLLQSAWVYFRRLVSPIFPFRKL